MRDAAEDADADQWWVDLKVKHWIALVLHRVLLNGLFKVLDDLLLMNQLDLFQ